jgi:hypothetical protein
LTGGEWRPLPFIPISTSAIFSHGPLASDFRSLPVPQWAMLHERFPSLPFHRSRLRDAVLLHQARTHSLRRSSERRGISADEALCFVKLDNLFQYALTEESPYEFFDFESRFYTVFEMFQDELVKHVTLANENIVSTMQFSSSVGLSP